MDADSFHSDGCRANILRTSYDTMAKPAKNQLNTTNKAAAGAGANASDIYGSLEPTYAAMATNPTASPIYNSDMTAARQSLGGATSGITGQGALTAARTRNSASIPAALDQGARQSMQDESQIAASLPGDIQKQGLSGLGGLEGQQIGQEDSLYGLGPATLNALTNEQKAPWQDAEGVLSDVGFSKGGFKV